MTTVFVGTLFPNIFPFVCCLILVILVYKRLLSKLINCYYYHSTDRNNSLAVSPNDQQQFNEPHIVQTKTVPDDVEHILLNFKRIPHSTQVKISEDFYKLTKNYRYPKSFTNAEVSMKIVENVLKAAGTSPSGVHTEPWTFAVIKNVNLKRNIRRMIETEERKYWERCGGNKTEFNFKKSYLETTPLLIIVFKQVYGLNEEGQRKTHYQNQVTTAMATGVLIAALQNVGLTTVPCMPLNAGPAIRDLLKRPINEKVLFLLPVGYPNETLPVNNRKSLSEIMKLFS